MCKFQFPSTRNNTVKLAQRRRTNQKQMEHKVLPQITTHSDPMIDQKEVRRTYRNRCLRGSFSKRDKSAFPVSLDFLVNSMTARTDIEKHYKKYRVTPEHRLRVRLLIFRTFYSVIKFIEQAKQDKLNSPAPNASLPFHSRS